MRQVAGTALVVAFLAALPPTAATAATTPARVTVIGAHSVVMAVSAWGNARSILGKEIDLQMQVAVCRRLTGESCPFRGSEPSNLVDLVSALGPALGKTVIVGVGYNDFEQAFAQSVEDSIQALLEAGVTRVFWVTLRETRQPYVNMNDVLVAAAKQHAADDARRLEHVFARPPGMVPDRRDSPTRVGRCRDGDVATRLARPRPGASHCRFSTYRHRSCRSAIFRADGGGRRHRSIPLESRVRLVTKQVYEFELMDAS